MRRAAGKVLRFFLWIYVAYLALSVLIVMPLLNIAAPWAVREFTGRELRHEIIVFNPFTLTVELRGASIHERDDHVPLAVRKAAASLGTASIWRPGIVLDRVHVEDLALHVLRYSDGRFHFDDLLAAPDAPPPEDTGELPGITVDSLYFGARELRFTDRTRAETFSAAYRDFVVETKGISTLPARRGDGDLVLRNADGGELSWSGELAIAEGRSAGTLGVHRFDLIHVWRYESERLAFITDSALIDLDLQYSVDWSDGLAFTVSDGLFRVHDLLLTPKDEEALPNTDTAIGDLVLRDIAVDSATQTVSLDSVSLRGLRVRGFTDEGRSSIVEMFAVAGSEKAAAPGATDAASAEPDTAENAAPWQLRVGKLSVDDSLTQWRTNNLAPEAMTMTPLSVSAEDISWPAEGASPFSLGFTVNEQLRVTLDGSLHLGDGGGAVNYRVDGLPLAWINPTLHRYAKADITGGILALSGDVALQDFLPTRIGNDLALADFAAQIHGAEDSAVSFGELSVTGTTVDMDAAQVDIEDIALIGLRSALHILEDGSFNATSALVEAPAADDGDAALADSATAGESDATDGGPDWGARIAHVGVRDGRIDFSDASLPLPFQTLIGDIEADIVDLDSRSEQPLVATLNGAVDGYAPVVIEARGTPIAEPRDATLSLSFRGMDIATMSPYSGTYAGYTIDSGTLTVDLRYGVQGSQLDGDNRIIISQMELGEPIESELAMQLPLQLGIALLTDANGVIDLDVPISGDVNDPKFSLGKVIGGAIANVIIKAATAPFRLLAGLAGSDEDLENIPFAAGSASLTEGGRSALGSLAEALKQRPKLQLRIVGSTDPAADRRALRQAELERSLIADGLSAADIAARGDAFSSAVDTRYAALGLAAPEDGTAPTLDDKLEALRTRIELPPGALQDLGTSRATEAKRELVTVGGIDAARIAVAYDRALLLAGTRMSLDG